MKLLRITLSNAKLTTIPKEQASVIKLQLHWTMPRHPSVKSEGLSRAFSSSHKNAPKLGTEKEDRARLETNETLGLLHELLLES